MRSFALYLQLAGISATTAAVIKGKVDSIQLATGAQRVAIVGHSMGTMSARYYIKNLGGDGDVSAFVAN